MFQFQGAHYIRRWQETVASLPQDGEEQCMEILEEDQEMLISSDFTCDHDDSSQNDSELEEELPQNENGGPEELHVIDSKTKESQCESDSQSDDSLSSESSSLSESETSSSEDENEDEETTNQSNRKDCNSFMVLQLQSFE